MSHTTTTDTAPTNNSLAEHAISRKQKLIALAKRKAESQQINHHLSTTTTHGRPTDEQLHDSHPPPSNNSKKKLEFRFRNYDPTIHAPKRHQTNDRAVSARKEAPRTPRAPQAGAAAAAAADNDDKEDEEAGDDDDSRKEETTEKTVEETMKDLMERVKRQDEIRRATDLDLTKIQPKKPNWDLKRDLLKKLNKLDPITQASFATLIRKRMQAEGSTATEADAAALAKEMISGRASNLQVDRDDETSEEE